MREARGEARARIIGVEAARFVCAPLAATPRLAALIVEHAAELRAALLAHRATFLTREAFGTRQPCQAAGCRTTAHAARTAPPATAIVLSAATRGRAQRGGALDRMRVGADGLLGAVERAA